ncbi:FadR/GntR family transcriptional regulator [Azospirillum brasilense]|uniref:HTH gntR-type domain-containing protein n=1 Tax=Azospirillum brasilense TaxID=192 RepID=A0A235H2T5_AZOBR|nr:FCD domain-containing protein [Azospirillum brasilense]OYD80158.1 hypothetical protein CHT98_32725 [Azospirillum brasilense]
MGVRSHRAADLERLRRFLREHDCMPQDRLPPERSLAPLLGMGRTTLRACLEVLEAEGLVWRHVGQGTFYGPRPVHEPVRMSLLVTMTSAWDLMNARLTIEPGIAAAAALMATPAQIDTLRACIEEGRNAPDLFACERADNRFHTTLARTTGNPVLISFLEFVSGARSRAPWQREWGQTYRHIGQDEFQGEHSDQHKAIVDAVARQDAEQARDAMSDHLATIQTAMQSASSKGIESHRTRGGRLCLGAPKARSAPVT